jgi:mRNA interferase RelE/StbE
VKQDRDRYALVITPTARRPLVQHLPEAVAFAAHEFIIDALLDSPTGPAKRCHAPLEDRQSARRGTYRVIHRINDEQRTVTVVEIAHRRDAHRAKQ